MTLFRHEMKQGKLALAIWTLSIGLLMVICIFLFPEMKKEMAGVSKIFASMGSFTAAFGMDKINFGTLEGFYAIECGNVLGLGGAFFASMCGASVLAKEEKEHTAEFLLTHPVSRRRIVTEKLAAVFAQILILNLIIWVFSVGSIVLIGESVPWKGLGLLHLAYLLLQFELAAICFGVSAFSTRGSLGIGLGIASVMYFLNLIANIADSAEFLKYITPFGYAEGSEIMSEAALEPVLILPGMLFGAVGAAAAYWKYCRKDIQA